MEVVEDGDPERREQKPEHAGGKPRLGRAEHVLREEECRDQRERQRDGLQDQDGLGAGREAGDGRDEEKNRGEVLAEEVVRIEQVHISAERGQQAPAVPEIPEHLVEHRKVFGGTELAIAENGGE